MAQPKYVSREDFGKGALALSGEPVLLRKQFVCEDIAKVLAPTGDASRQRKFVISTSSVDRDNDTIALSGWLLDNYKRNPVVLFAHDYSSLPIGKAVSIGIENEKLVAVVEFATHQMADTVLQLVDGGYLRATSVGFRPTKIAKAEDRDGYDFKEQELLEFSVVPVPANPEALIMADASGLDVQPLKAWAVGVLKAMKAQTEGGQGDDICTACGGDVVDGVCTGCGWHSPEGHADSTALNPATLAYGDDDPIRWNKALSKAFDVDGEPLDASKLEYTWVSRFLATPVKDLYETTVHISSPRMGSYLSALEDLLAPYKTETVRRLHYTSREEPPVFETLQLNSKLSRSFLVDGIRFLTGPAKMVVKMQPSWAGEALTLYCPMTGADKACEFLQDVAVRAASYKFMRGEAFALSGEFLQRGTETWDDLFLSKTNTDPLARMVAAVNEKGAEVDSRGAILAGPPGTGKTLAGRVMMNDAKDSTFIWVSSRDFYRSGAHGGIMLAFDLARENAPSIIFMEDIDSWLDREAIDMLKTELDGIKQHKGIVTVLTTNFPEQLPEALIDRPGRFHDVLILALPDATIRRAMLAKWAPAAKGETLDALAKDTTAFSGAHLRDLVRYADTLRAQDGTDVDAALVKALEKVRAQRQLIDETRRGPRLRAMKDMSPRVAYAKAFAPKRVPKRVDKVAKQGGPGEEAAELVAYQAMNSILDQVASMLSAARSVVTGLISDEVETPTETPEGEAAECALECARLQSLQAFCRQMFGALSGVCDMAEDMVRYEAMEFASQGGSMTLTYNSKRPRPHVACAHCGKDSEIAVGVCGPCVAKLQPWDREAAADRVAQMAKGMKRGRVLSSMNESRIKAAKDYCARTVEHLDAVLAQLAEIPIEGTGDADGNDAEEAAAHVIDIEIEDVVTAAAEHVDLEIEEDDAIDLEIEAGDDDVSIADMRLAMQSVIASTVGEFVRDECAATVRRLRGRVD